MTPETLTALKASIEHWRQNAEGPIEDASADPDDCALCDKFLSGETRCLGCPVSESTGHILCFKTPYEIAHIKLRRTRDNASPENEAAFRAAARAELAFLISLLPEGENPTHEEAKP